MKMKTQWMPAEIIREYGFPPSVVQSGMSPSISEMIKTRRVGGNLDAHEMDGVESDAPFDSEYMEVFDILDMSEEQLKQSALERKKAEQSTEKVEPQVVENQEVKND